MSNNNKTGKIFTSKRLKIVIFLIFAICAYFVDWQRCMQMAGVYAPVGDGMSVTFLDVGKADATFINAGDYNILIDAGIDRDAQDITNFLDRYAIDSLDMVIASHGDSDHIGGMATILNTYRVDSFLTFDVKDRYKPSLEIYYSMLDAIEKNNVNVTYTKAGDTYKLGKIKVEVLSPDHEYKDNNDDSVIVKVNYGKTDFLFTGDASKDVEEYLLKNNVDVKCDVLKVAHHGSSTSTTEHFLQAVNPAIAVVPVGENINNLPNVEVIKRLKNFGLELYRSDYHGDVTLVSDGREITVFTEK